MKVVLYNGKWAVVANWLGAERVVFSSDNIFACIRFVNSH